MSAACPAASPRASAFCGRGARLAGMTRRVFHIRGLAGYFGVLLAYAAVHSFSQGKPVLDVR